MRGRVSKSAATGKVMDIVFAFITGLTTGGLSCLAVQGGLLASSIAHEVEDSVREHPVQRGGRNQDSLRAGRPIVLFLAAKILAYTILGFLLGLAGSLLQLSPIVRAILQGAIGIFMVGTALRMLNIHPIFRYFSLEPPRFVTRFIRRQAKTKGDVATPLFLGLLTVLIPCGVTQAMMAVAMGTGSPTSGAAIMFAFTLGTSPVFFAVAYAATRLGARLEASFMRAVAVVVLVLGLISIDAGLTLAGSPFSVSNLRLALSGSPATVESAGRGSPGPHVLPPARASGPASSAGQSAAALNAVVPPEASDRLTISVRSSGYSPKLAHAKADRPLELSLVTNNTYSCARSFVIPSLGVQKTLPTTGTVVINVPAQRAGSKLFYSCSMGMYSGMIVFDG
jgi:sulfite exporter TauE/SafE